MGERAIKERMDQNQKTERAFQAYVDLLDAAEYMRAQVYDQLAFYDLTMNGFRLMELLMRYGPMRATVMAERCQWNRQNLDVIVRRLEENAWVRRELVPASEQDASRGGKADGLKGARRVSVLSLTPEGSELMSRFLPKHGKVIKAHMRALDGREQESLSAICRKLMKGNILKFISEMEHVDPPMYREG
jgi:DNA-binding MarR family transcriptional regulator